jgi:predicted RNA-binding Zn-ribbon protein involved in translation (DUF1610 family)
VSIGDDIARERRLRRQMEADRIYKKDGLRVREVSSAQTVFYCPTCKGPVVNSEHGRKAHARRFPKCGIHLSCIW